MKKLKKVNKSKNPGLAKLPEEVRNKMGYMKEGGVAAKRTKGQAEKKMSKAELAVKSLESQGITPEMLANIAMGRMGRMSKATKTMKKINKFANRAKLRQNPAVKDLSFKRTSPKKLSNLTTFSKKVTPKQAARDISQAATAGLSSAAAAKLSEDVFKKATKKSNPYKPSMTMKVKSGKVEPKKIKEVKVRKKMINGGQVQSSNQIGDAVATFQGSGNYKAGE